MGNMMMASNFTHKEPPHGEIIGISIAVALHYPTAITARTRVFVPSNGVWIPPLSAVACIAALVGDESPWAVGWDDSLRQTRAGDHPFLRPKEPLSSRNGLVLLVCWGYS